MEAKEQHGSQRATWRPKSNMEAKEQHGSPEATCKAKESHGGQRATWRPRSNMEVFRVVPVRPTGVLGPYGVNGVHLLAQLEVGSIPACPGGGLRRREMALYK